MDVTVRFEPGWERNLAEAKRDLLERIGRAVLRDMRAGCPRDTGRLLASLGYDVDAAEDTVRVGSHGVDYAASVEAGSRPHIIESHGPWPLRNRETGQVFGRRVHHPGTKAQPFMRPAAFRVVGNLGML